VLTSSVQKFDILSRGDNVVYQRNEEDDPEWSTETVSYYWIQFFWNFCNLNLRNQLTMIEFHAKTTRGHCYIFMILIFKILKLWIAFILEK
jgi:hypothetical protein